MWTLSFSHFLLLQYLVHVYLINLYLTNFYCIQHCKSNKCVFLFSILPAQTALVVGCLSLKPYMHIALSSLILLIHTYYVSFYEFHSFSASCSGGWQLNVTVGEQRSFSYFSSDWSYRYSKPNLDDQLVSKAKIDFWGAITKCTFTVQKQSKALVGQGAIIGCTITEFTFIS